MERKDVVKLLEENITPDYDINGFKSYRASAYLSDGTYLPCVLFSPYRLAADYAIKTFKPYISNPKFNYKLAIGGIIAGRNLIKATFIDKIEKSPYALSSEFYNKTKPLGATEKWISFTAIMDDGKEFGFGTLLNCEFFEMPEGYSADRITDVIPDRQLDGKYFKVRPYFECYI